MDEVVVWTVVDVPPEDAFSFLRDFPGYAGYSEYLRRIDQHGDGSAGTVFEIEVAWWRLRYTVRTAVTAIDPPERIEWEVERALNAYGFWEVEAVDRNDRDEPASKVTLHIRYDPSTTDSSVVQLPRFVSLGWVVERVRPLVAREAESIVERVVADLEGEPRPVELTIETRRG